MLIGVDCGCLGVKDERLKVGVYAVAKNLLENLGKIDKRNNYLLYSFYPIEKSLMKKFGPRMKNVIVNPTKFWMKIWLPYRITKDKPDVFLGLSQAVPSYFPFTARPYTISFFYDLGFEKFPQMYPGFLSKLKRNSLYAGKNSHAILSISKSTKKDIINLYHIKPSKIKVSYPSVGKEFSRSGKKYKSKKPYFLFVGAMKQTKNIPTLIKAFNYFLEKSGLKFDLYIVGGDKWFDKGIEKKNKNIKFLGFIKDETRLASLYRGAQAFVSPSFYEGFGLIFLEAMKSGCPVITSNVGSTAEVVGEAAILLNPKNYKQIGEAMIEVYKDKRKRKLMREKGLKKSREFSWEKFTSDVLSLISKGNE